MQRLSISKNKSHMAWQIFFAIVVGILFFISGQSFAEDKNYLDADLNQLDQAYLSEFETYLPNTSILYQPRYEKKLLIYYLNNPNKPSAAAWLAGYHLHKLKRHSISGGEKVKHAVLAHYFLNRLKVMGVNWSWLNHQLNKNEERLAIYSQDESIPSDDEEHPAHQYYRNAFHFNEQNRHLALAGLLDDFASEPNNVYTAFTINAINLWIGGEADYDDPSALYNFILGSYFSTRTMDMAQRLEEAWMLDPTSAKRFRLSPILGGFSLLQRRWLALVHGDIAAVAAIDDEHRQWRLVNRAFHAFTVGLPFFEEPENFGEGFFAMVDGLEQCSEDPELRTCLNRPRFSYNLLGFILEYIDFFIKQGDITNATALLQYRHAPHEAENWAAWDLGREAWLHREENLNEIAALYQNEDPSDDPLHFQMKAKKWGSNTTTCQTCHQVQGLEWTPEEFNTVLLPTENVATVGTWPVRTTSWWAEIVNN